MTAALVCPPWSLVVTVIEVCVATLCALATATGSTQQRHTQSCNQLKPQTAAVHASHVHLLQISRRIAHRQIAYRPFP